MGRQSLFIVSSTISSFHTWSLCQRHCIRDISDTLVMAAATVTIVRPVLGFDGSSYTAEGTLIHVGKANLTLGIAGVLTDKAKGFHSVLVPYTGNPVLDGSTEIIPPITSISTSGQPAGTQARATTTAIAPSNRADTDQSASSSKQHTLSSSRDDASTSTSSSVSNSAATGASAQTPSSSTPSSSVGSEHDASNGIASGAAAGIGIGCAAVGALIAGLLVFLLMRKRRNKNPLPREYSLDEKSPTSPQQAGGNSRSLDPASGTSAFALAERDLPQPLEDAAIGGEMSRLQTLVKNYAQSYYLTSPVAAKNVDLTELGPSLPVPAPTLAAMLASPKTRISAIRFCLMWTIISRVGTDNEPSTSLLPPEVSNLLRSMPTASHAHSKSNPFRKDMHLHKRYQTSCRISRFLLPPSCRWFVMNPAD